MKMVYLLCLAMVARADFSYTQTQKSASGRTTKHYLKGQKMLMDSGDTATLLDFDAQTVTSINNKQKTYTVTKFGEMGPGADGVETKLDVKETGQRKNVNGYDAKELLMTMEIDNPRGGPKMQAEMSMWLSADVPGRQELHAFYQRNMGRFPWAALAGANSNMRAAMVEMQRKLASMDGVTVLQVVRMKAPGAAAPAGQSDQMAQARARLEEMKKQGGPQAAAAEQALARMGGGGSSGSMFEVTTESSNFSTSVIPDSTFAIPAGYQQTEKK